MQRPVKAGLPVVEGLLHLGEIGSQIVILGGFEIGNVVEDMRGSHAITFELTLQIR
ncbi:hypothetical protein RLEG12_09440 (plasmid) [Rhizobium leguminosarum bv. trifolii CB782]|nr:hypothetical protein RLEG12_09440 [Rhizobium leguminosarum bv. trifolii CB782]